jgi:hypothetical protein
MTYLEFRDKYLGKQIDWDKAYGGQCVDVYRQYCNDLGFKQSAGVVGAVDIWTTYLKTDFDKVENSLTGVPPQGSVVIWDKTVGPYGHVAICDSGTTKSFKSIDQNWPVDNGTGVVHYVTHNYNGVLGWLIPKLKVEDNMTEEQKRILDFLAGKTEGDVREAFGAIGQVANLSKEIEGLKSSLKDMTGRVEQLEADAQANNTLILDWQNKVSAANSKVSKLEAEIKVQSDEKNTWKNRYEEALKIQINKYTGWQLIKLGIQKLKIKK